MARILVADDAVYARKLLVRILDGAGHSVVGEAEDGEEAVTLFERLRPDVVILDLLMPRKDGIEVVREIVARHPRARIIVLSALAYERKVVDAMAAGAFDFLPKPVDAARLLERVAAALA